MAIRESKNYYTVAEAKKILGITNEMLYNYVENGALERVVTPGKKQGVYNRNQVDQLARELQSFMIQKKRKPTQFKRVETREEMAQTQEISQALFGVGNNLVDDRMEILKRNPHTYYMIKDEDQTIGYTAIWPLKPGKLNNLLSQKIPVKVSPEDIATFDKKEPIDIYLDVMGIKPGFTIAEKHSYGSRLVAGLMGIIIEWGKRGVVINTIAARSNMPDGIRLMRKLGFTEVSPLTPERRTFIIDVEKYAMPLMQQYKKALEESTTSQ
jgi:hypothetical protein